MFSGFANSVILTILRHLPLEYVLRLRETSKGLWSIVQRLFRDLFSSRPMVLDHVLTHNKRWEPSGPAAKEHRTLEGLRALYAGPVSGPISGPVSVCIVARFTNGTFFPTSYQVDVISRFLRCGRDRVNLRLCPHCEYGLEDLCSFRDFIQALSVKRGPLKIGQIRVLRKILPHDLTSLDLSGVSVPLASGAKTRTNRAKKDATREMTKLLEGLSSLVNLSLKGTLLDVSLLPLSPMTRMQSLDLSNTRADSKRVADAISGMRGLTILNLGYMRFESTLAAVVFSLPLKRLSIPCCMVTDAAILSEAAHGKDTHATESMESMDLSWNRLSSVADLSKLIRSLPRLTEMNLSETFTDHDELAPMLIGSPSVTFTLTFPSRGRLVDHDQRRTFQGTNLRYSPRDHGA